MFYVPLALSNFKSFVEEEKMYRIILDLKLAKILHFDKVKTVIH